MSEPKSGDEQGHTYRWWVQHVVMPLCVAVIGVVGVALATRSNEAAPDRNERSVDSPPPIPLPTAEPRPSSEAILKEAAPDRNEPSVASPPKVAASTAEPRPSSEAILVAAPVASATSPNVVAKPSCADWPLVAKESFGPTSAWPAGARKDDWGSLHRRVEDGVYRWQAEVTADGYGRYELAPKIGIQHDFYLAVDVKIDPTCAGAKNAGAGLTFRQTGLKYYEFLWSLDGYYTLRSVSDSNKAIVDWARPPEQLDGFNRIAVCARGSTFKLFVNNRLVGTYSDKTLREGNVGLRVFGLARQEMVVFFDNFELRAPAAGG